jgi:PAS domain S-box-containing protein/putative nucleotidyltransferase with HDIG domain
MNIPVRPHLPILVAVGIAGFALMLPLASPLFDLTGILIPAGFFALSGGLIVTAAILQQGSQSEIEQAGNEPSPLVLDSENGKQASQPSDSLRQLQIDRMPIACIVWDDQFRITSWNPAAEKIFGYPADEVIGRRPHGLILDEKASLQVDKIWSRLLVGDDTAHSVNKNLTKDGRTILCEWSNTPLAGPDGKITRVLSMAQDITERVRAQEALSASEARFRNLFDSLPTALYRTSPEGQILETNQALVDLLGYPDRETLLAQNVTELYVEPEERVRENILLELQGLVHGVQFQLRRYDGRVIWVRDISRIVKDEEDTVLYYEGSLEEITDYKQAEKLQSAIYTISQATVSTKSVDELYHSIHRILGELMPVENFYIALYDPTTDLLSFPYFVDQYDPPGPPVKAGRGLTEFVLRHGRPLLASPQVFAELVEQGEIELVGTDSVDWLGVPLKIEDRVIGVMVAQSYTEDVRYSQDNVSLFEFVSTQVALAIERKRTEEKIRQDAFRAQTLVEVSRQIAAAGLDCGAILAVVTRSVSDRTGDACGIRLFSENGKEILLESFYHPQSEIVAGVRMLMSTTQVDFGNGLLSEILQAGEPVTFESVQGERTGVLITPECRTMLAQVGVHSLLIAPLQAQGKTIGALSLARSGPAGAYGDDDRIFLQEIAGRTGLAIASAQLFEKVQHSLSKVQALRQIDIAITGSIDLRISLGTVLEQVISQLGVDAAGALVLNPYTLTLDFVAGRGFRTTALQNTHLRLGEGYAGRAALENRVLNIPDLRNRKTDILRSPAFGLEDFVAYYAVPLTAQGRVKGVLEIFHRRPLNPVPDWLEFLEALAGQAAIAIDNASLFHDLQHSNQELILAYDATIEGWSHALDLRDRETEGHTRRVTELTLRLAREFGISDEELVHVRRGALLHDIGKMGIPDRILLKSGSLTKEERMEMQKHPEYAFDLLSPIAYLRPALDIPYCHHEKWDGTGYPRGLKGEDIPLVARIFAVVDVWDALCSDRPYRPAWKENQALAYIQGQIGKHFDPRVVEMFLKAKPWTKLLPLSLEESGDLDRPTYFTAN